MQHTAAPPRRAPFVVIATVLVALVAVLALGLLAV